MSRRSKHSPGADGLPLLERNEEAIQQELAPPLAHAHGITYPADLERVVSDQLEKLWNTHLS